MANRWHSPPNAPYPPDAEDAPEMEDKRAINQQGAWNGANPDAQAGEAGSAGESQPSDGAFLRASIAVRQLDRWLQSMERLRLADYVRYVDDRKRLFWSSFLGGMARGVGMAVGFTILGAVLVLVLQDLAKHNLPVIGDFLAQIVSVVQKRLK